MNVKTIVAVAIAVSLVSLTGCAGMKSKDSSAMAPAPAPATYNTNAISLTSGLSDDVDVAYINEINEQANEKGYLVLWLNPPQKKLQQMTQHD